ncbi:hypothetical protein ACE01N_14765 [Saccharicrinis sp. FJH2]|uniref:hypothetical protein n=1 Tax=Saccharicrinis sp. FJH65 TaxID=3344659 RepID=UPI0035F4CD22
MVEPDSKIIKSWRKENDFEKVAKHPDVLELISNHAGFSNSKINSGYLIDKFDLVFGTFTGISPNFIMEIALPIYRKLGLRTGKKDKIIFDESVNDVFVKVLCAVSANKKLEFKEFHQAQDGLLIISKIKSDFLSSEGNLTIELQQTDNGVIVNINAMVKGQLYDYGKCKRIVSKVLTDLKTIELK